MTVHNKLVRDKILERIIGNGGTYEAHIATDDEYWVKLKEKLQEEVDEFLKAESHNDMVEELADIFQVLDEIMSYRKISPNGVHGRKRKKAIETGVFDKRIILESTS